MLNTITKEQKVFVVYLNLLYSHFYFAKPFILEGLYITLMDIYLCYLSISLSYISPNLLTIKSLELF